MSPNPPHPRSTPPPRWSEGAASAERPPPSPRADRSTDQSRRIPPTAPTRPGWHDWFNRAGRLREAPTHERGLDPTLERSYAALGSAFGATEAEVRIAYRKCVRRVHPDSGGSPKQLARVHDALEAIDRDAWSHGEGAAALREALLASERSRFLRRRGRRSRGSSCRWPCTETPRGCTL